jgi:hypothetical protein
LRASPASLGETALTHGAHTLTAKYAKYSGDYHNFAASQGSASETIN